MWRSSAAWPANSPPRSKVIVRRASPGKGRRTSAMPGTIAAERLSSLGSRKMKRLFLSTSEVTSALPTSLRKISRSASRWPKLSRFWTSAALSDWGWGVKLLLVPAVPAGHSLLSAVGAEAAASWGPEGGRPNLLSDLQGDRPSALGCYRDRLARRPRGNDTAPPVAGRKLDRLQAAGTAPSSPQRNSEPSAHIRCRTQASLRATATRARAMPRRLATCMPQARRADHFRLRTSSEWAASYKAVLASSSPHRLMPPCTSVSPDW